jgi:hypothetical protein
LNRQLFILLSLALLVGLTACSAGNPLPTATLTPDPSATEGATRTSVASQTPRRTATRSRAHTPTPTEAIVLPEPVGTPATRWNGIPIMPDATTGEEDEDAYFYSVAATPEEVEAYYAEQLPPLGWQLFAEGTGENGATLILYKKGSSILTLSIIVLEDHVQVLITLI